MELRRKKEFKNPEEVDKDLGNLIANDFTEKVLANLKEKDIKI